MVVAERLRERSPVPRVSAEHLDARRVQILDAARACFALHGFHRTTMAEICAAARLSPGAVYRYFPSKEAIVGTLWEQELQRNVAQMAGARMRESFAAALDDLLGAFVTSLDELCGGGEQGLDLELWAEASRNPQLRELWQRVLAGLRAPIAEIVRRAQARGEVAAALDPESVAAAGLAFFYGLLLQRLMDPLVDVGGAVRVLRALFDGTARGAVSPQSAPDRSASCTKRATL